MPTQAELKRRWEAQLERRAIERLRPPPGRWSLNADDQRYLKMGGRIGFKRLSDGRYATDRDGNYIKMYYAPMKGKRR